MLIDGTNIYITHSTSNNEKQLQRKYLRHLADALMIENVENRRPTSLQSELKLNVLKRKAELGFEAEMSLEKKRLQTLPK